MRKQRSALLGLALSLAVLGVAACEDKTEVVIPTPEPPALQISVTPAAVTLEEGQSAQIVAQVTGGATGGDKSVTWASSNTAVATAAGNGNVVTVSAVSAGVTTITATATADANVKAAASVTVTAAGGNVPPTISIKSITTGATNVPVNINNVFGQVEVTLNLDVPQGAAIDRVEILVDGTVIYTQSFSGVELGAALDEAQSAVDLVASWNTAQFVLPAKPWTVGNIQGAHLNGQRTITAQVVGPQGTVTATTSTQITLNNLPFIYAVLSSPTDCVLSTVGLRWCTGDIVVDALGVKYNDNAANDVASIAMTATGNVVKTVGDAAAPFSLTLQKASSPSATSISGMEFAGVAIGMSTLTAGGAVGPTCVVTEATPVPLNLNCAVLGGAMLQASPLNEDNVAPTITLFDLTPATLGCAPATACFISGNPATPAFIFSVRAGFFAHTDAGVGSPTATFMAGPDASSLIPVTTGADLAETVVPSLIASATTCDALQNCRTQYASTGGVGQNSATGAQLVGVDSTDPTATVSAVIADKSINVVNSPAWTISFSDGGVGPSGFSAMPVSVQLKNTRPAGSTCYIPDSPFTVTTVACLTSSGAVNYQADDGIIDIDYAAVPGTSEGYWEIDAFVNDQANNFSKPSVARITLNDVTAPVIGGISSPSTLPGGQAASFSAGIGDNVDLLNLMPWMVYGGTTFQFNTVTLGAYGVADGLVSTANGTFAVSSFMRSIEPTLGTGRAGGAVTEAATVGFDVNDVALNQATSSVNINAAVQFAAGGAVPSLTVAPTDVIFAPANVLHGNFLNLPPSNPQVCRGTSSACGATPPASTVLSATMTGPNSTFANPFNRVEFYYQDPVNLRWYLIGTGAPSASDNTVSSTRTWTYSVTWTVTGLLDSTGAPLVNAAVNLVAVGVHSSGSAVISTGTPQTIDITAT